MFHNNIFKMSGLDRIVLIFIQLFAIIQCQQLSIQPSEPQTKQYMTGVIFTCVLTDFDVYRGQNPVVRWKDNRNQWVRQTSGRVYKEQEDIGKVKLYITEIQAGDEGLYQCQADVNGQTLVQDSRLYIYEAIKFEDTPTYLQQVAGIGSPLLECKATGQPQPVISWRFNRRKIPNIDGDIKYRYETGGLRIFNINASDNGTYECRAEVQDQANFQVRSIYLEVLYPPIIERGPLSAEVVEGDDVTMSCDAHGNPTPTYEWLLEQQLTEMSTVMRPLANSNAPSYTVRNIQKSSEGRYFCSVRNNLGNPTAHADITVLVPPRIVSLPDKNMTEGQTILLPCEAVGEPTPDITWFKPGSKRPYDHIVQPNDANIRITSAQAGFSKLTISEADRSYTGEYTCIARNKAGETSQASRVVIEYQPTANVSVTEQLGWAGQSREFSCSSQGLPRPSISWVKGGTPLFNSTGLYTIVTINGSQGTDVTSVLKIQIGESQTKAVYGAYKCVGKNKHGTVQRTLTLTQATGPGMPRDMSVLETHMDYVVIGCATPARSRLPIIQWNVEYFPENEPENVTDVTFDGSEEKFELRNLSSGQTYHVALSAANAVGFGEALKFTIKTESELTNQQQSDIPVPGRDNNHNTYMGANVGVDDIKIEKPSVDANREDAVAQAQVKLVNIIGIVVGIIVIFLLIIFILVVIRRRYRKSGEIPMRHVVDYGGTQTVHVTSGEDPDDLKLNIISHESYADGKGTLVRSPLDARRANGGTGTLPRKNRKMSETTLIQTPDGRGTEQAKMWEDTLQRQRHHLSDEEFGEGEVCVYNDMTLRSNPMVNSVHSAVSEMEWPPPPSPDTCTLSRSGYHPQYSNIPAAAIVDPYPPPAPEIHSLTRSGYGSLQCADSQSYHAVLDGYMSGDNIEEDGEDDAFIRPPSPVRSPVSSVRSPSDIGRVPSDYEQSSYRCYDPIS